LGAAQWRPSEELHHAGIAARANILVGYADRQVFSKEADGGTKMISGLSLARHPRRCLRPTKGLIKCNVVIRAGEQRDRACVLRTTDVLKLITNENTSGSRRQHGSKLVARFGAARHSG
jgi:hypothetical protein